MFIALISYLNTHQYLDSRDVSLPHLTCNVLMNNVITRNDILLSFDNCKNNLPFSKKQKRI